MSLVRLSSMRLRSGAMRTSVFSVVVMAGAAALLAQAAPALADAPWFAAGVSTPIPNGAGPGPAPRGTVGADFTGDGEQDVVTIGNFTFGTLLLAPGNGDGTFG